MLPSSADSNQYERNHCRPAHLHSPWAESQAFESRLIAILEHALPRINCDQNVPVFPTSQADRLNHGQWSRLLSSVFLGANMRYAEWQNASELLCRCLINSDTLENALKLIERFPRNHCIPNLKLSSNEADIVLSIDGTNMSWCIELLQAASCMKLLSWLIDEPIAALRAHVMQTECTQLPMLVEPLFNCSIRTECDQFAIAIDRALLTRPVVRTYTDLRTILALPSLALIPWPLAKSLRIQVFRLIDKAVTRYGQVPTIPEIALLLGRGASSLRRQLCQEGTSFQAIKNAWREQRAKELLRGSAPLDEIAPLLGFECSSVFSRAFKSWTGMAPSTYRHLHRGV